MADGARMKGKRVLVTGSGTGIGRGMALEFAREGAAVALHYAHSDKGALSAVAEIRRAGGSAEAFEADFNDVGQAKELPIKAAEFLGGLDVLVNNAGITMNRPFTDVTPEQYDTLYDVNVRAMFFAAQSAAVTMIEQGAGAIINISSGHAFAGAVEHSVYAGTKAAIVGFTRTLAVELIQKGIRVNAIASGWVLVENQRAMIPEDFDEEQAGLVLPAGFIGEARDIGRVAIFLASDEARYIIGQTLVCDGGQTSLMAAAGDFRKPGTDIYGKGYVPGL
ncbi:MAG: SDR family oxidoreductase [Lentisphaeria bacterium]|jgi:NAD(P)-dependent dehydrogenase (short-subunit alcohol dehydrogenase family)|nr:SDR family oxidoreductase [Lentisphaeria bacterium]MDP7742080.1 SDR family oxidoreductase [Lentisphaeria bacterium]